MKYILKNINLLNILLVVAIVLFINYTILPLLNMGVRFTLPSVKKSSVHEVEKTAESTIPSLTDYTMIADENLFHPERRIPTETSEVSPAQKPEFVLYGVVITDDTKLAYLEDIKSPYSTVGRGKRQTVLRKGDVMSGYSLKEIYTDKVVMARGEESMTVYVYDSSELKSRTVDRKAPGREISKGHTAPASEAALKSLKLEEMIPALTKQRMEKDKSNRKQKDLEKEKAKEMERELRRQRRGDRRAK